IGTVAVDPPRLALSPDGKRLYVGDEAGKGHAYDWATGREGMSFEPHAPAGRAIFEWPGIRSMALSLDGRTPYSVGPAKTISATDLSAETPLAKPFGDTRRVDQVVVSTDGTRVAAAGGGTSGRLALLDARTGANLVPQPGHAGMINSVVVTANDTV